MNPKSAASFVIIFTFLSVQSISQWQQTAVSTGEIRSFVENNGILFAGKSGLIYSTTNGGLNWESIIINGSVMALTSENGILYAGTQSEGIFYSSNNGGNWSNISLGALGLSSLGVSSPNILVGTSSGLRLTSNNGQSWITPVSTGTNPGVITVNGSNVYVGSFGGSVYRSTNNGINFTSSILGPGYVDAIAVNGNIVYAGKYNTGVFISSNGGVNWTQSTLNNQKVHSLAVTGSNVFAGTEEGVFFSFNGGETWTQINEGLTNTYIQCLIVHNQYVYAGTNGTGIWKRNLSELIGINQISSEIPSRYNLYQNYPNPFNPATKIKFSLPETATVKLSIYNANGQLVQTPVNQQLNAGTYEAEFSGTGRASGIYFYTITTERFTETRKMVLVK